MSDIRVTASITGAPLVTWSPTFQSPCTSLGGACIDIFATVSGKLFTSSPSVVYLDRIGVSATNGFYAENGSLGPVGVFYKFTWDNANALCNTYKRLSIGGRTNWELATKHELKVELYDVFSESMFTARGWPTYEYYWSETPDGFTYPYVNLHNGNVDSGSNSYSRYASCVSDP